MPEHEFCLTLDDLRNVPKGFDLREFRVADKPGLVDLYNRDNALRTGSVVRHGKIWAGFQFKGPLPARLRVLAQYGYIKTYNFNLCGLNLCGLNSPPLAAYSLPHERIYPQEP